MASIIDQAQLLVRNRISGRKLEMKYCFLIARPRSGTTALRDVLHNCSDLQAIGEIFADNEKLTPTPFIYWAAKFTADREDLRIPNGKSQSDLLRGYLQFVAAQKKPTGDAACTLVTVNYNSLHMMNTIWQNLFDAPYICSLIKQNRYGAIHLIRRNILRTLVSEQRARETKIWHRRAGAAETSSEERSPVTTINVATLIDDLAKRKWEIDLVSRFFDGYEFLKTIYYEDIFGADDQPVEAQFLDMLKFLTLPAKGVIKTQFLKTSTGTLQSQIANWDEVCAVLRGGESEWMLQSGA